MAELYPLFLENKLNNNLPFGKFELHKIILFNTYNEINNYFNSFNRYNKKYLKIPSYTISYDGTIYKHYDPEYHKPDFGSLYPKNYNFIFIGLENMGYLNNINNKYFDVYGRLYTRNQIYEKNWRNKRYWDDYNENQIVSLVTLLKHLCVKYDIEYKPTLDNVYIDNVFNDYTILTNSNIKKDKFDLSPSIKKHIKLFINE